MKITMYELLGMAKDGKLMPKKIKFENYTYIWRDTQKDYFCEQINHSLESIIGEYLFNNLNLEVEILEEEKEIPKKLNYEEKYMSSSNGFLLQYCVDFATKIDEIIDCLDYIKSKGE